MIKHDEDKLPMYTVIVKQFPNALKQAAARSMIGHNKYAKTDVNWDNFKAVSKERYLEACMRHLLEGEHTVDKDGLAQGIETLHIDAALWNLLAYVELSHVNTDNNKPVSSS